MPNKGQNCGGTIARTQSRTGVIWGEFWMLVRTLQRNKARVLWPQSHHNIQSSSKCVFMLLPDCSLLLAPGILLCLYGKRDLSMCSLFLSLLVPTASIYEDFTHVTPSHPQRRNCLMPWTKLALAWDFSRLPMSASFLPIQPCLES